MNNMVSFFFVFFLYVCFGLVFVIVLVYWAGAHTIAILNARLLRTTTPLKRTPCSVCVCTLSLSATNWMPNIHIIFCAILNECELLLVVYAMRSVWSILSFALFACFVWFFFGSCLLFFYPLVLLHSRWVNAARVCLLLTRVILDACVMCTLCVYTSWCR